MYALKIILEYFRYTELFNFLKGNPHFVLMQNITEEMHSVISHGEFPKLYFLFPQNQINH